MHGACRGADMIAHTIANRFNFNIQAFPANWKEYGRKAGPIRNEEMLLHRPDLVLAFHNNLEKSRGTKHVVTKAVKMGIPVEIIGEETVAKARFEVKKTEDDKWMFNLVAANNEIIATSEKYNSKQSCLSGIEAVKKVAEKAPVEEKD